MPFGKVVPIKRTHFDHTLTKVLLSNRQYAALRLFINSSTAMQVDEALSVDQRSMGSLFYRGYIKFSGHGFSITSLGKQAMSVFETTNVMKEKPGTAFSTYMNTVKALSHYRRSA